MSDLPNTLALTTIADGSPRIASPVRNNFADVATAVNALKDALAGGTAGQLLRATDADTVAWATPAMTQICDLTLSGSQASFDTNTILGGNIPATYNHLKLVLQLREDDAVVTVGSTMRFNNDSAANYNSNRIQGQNSAAPTSSAAAAVTAFPFLLSVGASGVAGKFAAAEALIYDYKGTTAHKKVTGIADADGDNTGANMYLQPFSGTWRSTAAVTRIQVFPFAGNFVAGSRFTLYGLI